MLNISRRTFLAGCTAAAGSAAGMAYYATLIEPYWAEIHENPVNIPGFGTQLSGLKIAQLTDLHLDTKMPRAYPEEIARRVREELKPDIVAFTGDLTTHNLKYIDYGAQWLTSFGVPTVVCLGNHDYDPNGSSKIATDATVAERMVDALKGTNVKILRNAGTSVDVKGGKLWVAGVEDWYTGRSDPYAATAGMPKGTARLMLCHNPDGTRLVDETTEGGLILSGHTHGGQICLPWAGPMMLPIVDRDKGSGQFKLDKGSTLYVSRGVGFLLRARVLCRPEVVVHKLA